MRIVVGVILLWMLVGSCSYASKLFLSPSTGEFVLGCPLKIDIILDTEGENTNTVDIKLIQSDKFEIIDLDTDNGIFSSYIKPKISKVRRGVYKGEKAIYMMGTLGGSRGFVGTGIFGTIVIIPKSMDYIDLNWYMLPYFNGDDTNVSVFKSGNIVDTLGEVIGGHYTLGTGECDVYSSSKVLKSKSSLSMIDPVLLADLQDLSKVDDAEEILLKSQSINVDQKTGQKFALHINSDIITEELTTWEKILVWLAHQVDKVKDLF